MNDKINSPYNTEVEKFVLGSALIDEKTANDLIASLQVEDFFDDKHKKIMGAILSLAKKDLKVDHLTVIEEISRANQTEAIGGADYIYSLIDTAPAYIISESYIDSIKEKSLERRLLEVTRDISDKTKNSEMPFKELMEYALSQVSGVVEKRKTTNFVTVDFVAEEVLEIIESTRNKKSELTGVDTGFPKLNDLTNGFQKGELIIVAARPSLGKSTLALNIATHVCKTQDLSVAFFSLEMGNNQLVTRILSSVSSVKLSDIRKGSLTDDEMAAIHYARNQIGKHKLHLYDSSFTDIRDIRLNCQKLKRENELDLVIIDYLQLVSADGKNRYEQVSKISRTLKILARELNVPVIALSQLSRAIDSRENKTPMLADLRESGSIEQDADIVMFLHKKSLAKDDDDTMKRLNSRIELLVLKNRQGPTGEVPLIFKNTSCTFSQFEEKK